MGVVYLAQHELTLAEAAVKILRPELMTQAGSRVRFLRELSAASRIGHPGVVQVIDAGVDQHGRFYIAMERLHGEDFGSCLDRGGLTMQQALCAIDDLLDPLTAAHDAGLVHRDLKPENIFLVDTGGRPRVKILDFGIVRELEQKTATATGMVVGTPSYMSPEQAARPRTVGPASDVWAVGVMLYEVLTGNLPFDGESAHGVVLNACHTAHVPVHLLVPRVDRRLSDLVDSCLSKDPALRPANARALKEKLAGLLEGARLDSPGRPNEARFSSAEAFAPTVARSSTANPWPASESGVASAPGPKQAPLPRSLRWVALALLVLGCAWGLSKKPPRQGQTTVHAASAPTAAAEKLEGRPPFGSAWSADEPPRAPVPRISTSPEPSHSLADPPAAERGGRATRPNTRKAIRRTPAGEGLADRDINNAAIEPPVLVRPVSEGALAVATSQLVPSAQMAPESEGALAVATSPLVPSEQVAPEQVAPVAAMPAPPPAAPAPPLVVPRASASRVPAARPRPRPSPDTQIKKRPVARPSFVTF